MVAIGLVTQRHSTTELFNSGNSRTLQPEKGLVAVLMVGCRELARHGSMHTLLANDHK